MAVELFSEIPGVVAAHLTSIYDDQKAQGKKIDLFIELADGHRIALQLSGPRDKEKIMRQINQLKEFPVIKELHNDEGEIIDKKLTLRAVVGFDRSLWGNAYNKFLAKKTENKISALPNKQEVMINSINNTIASMQLARQTAGAYAKDYDEAINYLNNVTLKKL
ncbi:MAG: hypothetical protein COU81_01250 [Candidatus Portnoybacteria bacterium CG10_big_fil_rev_8_21_14_0_10_36_7]|uniref:Uncharacterized protein n=1 Tax=Candidatus Portnoybacteria bacterium CG10_big_fil_rev_8_21_14_0_10_36_7 TaxID=1974812 RepID=A0A2M8KEJ2_9BACT|nr:MAG: hypothetical protein COU81_01250 [Candidatus Portnoybacteria bacterium CG10_big_fil_rev_8_21_14_0_10_36_7]